MHVASQLFLDQFDLTIDAAPAPRSVT